MADPLESNDPEVQKLAQKVDAFLYPPWSTHTPRRDIVGDEHLLTDFYQARLSKADWVGIPPLLRRAKKRTADAWKIKKKALLQRLGKASDSTGQIRWEAFWGFPVSHRVLTSDLARLRADGAITTSTVGIQVMRKKNTSRKKNPTSGVSMRSIMSKALK